uniref:Uncharacterized protein n=1 Tax=Zea mays TaxID=4577 RepID=B6SRA3_MAIZE|nr:hypothetical protein [Zea mays]
MTGGGCSPPHKRWREHNSLEVAWQRQRERKMGRCVRVLIEEWVWRDFQAILAFIQLT